MKCACLKNFGEKVEIVQTDIPKPNRDEVLVELKVCGFCHTDVHAMKGDWSTQPKLPLCPGHEGVGYVKEVGGEVQGINVGDYVGVPWLHSACGTCEHCTSGWETVCQKQTNSGYTVPGCFRQFTTIPAKFAVRIPQELSPEQAAPLLCAGVTSYKALKECEARPGQWVCILGAGGGLGHLAVQYAKAMGFRIVAVDCGAEKLEYCRSLGAEHAIDAGSTHSVPDQIKQLTDGGAHAVLVIASPPSVYPMSLDICRPKGVIVCVSLPAGSLVHLDMVKIVMRCLTLRGTVVGTRTDMMEALDFAKRGLVKCHVAAAPLDSVNEVFTDLDNDRIMGRVVLKLT